MQANTGIAEPERERRGSAERERGEAFLSGALVTAFGAPDPHGTDRGPRDTCAIHMTAEADEPTLLARRKTIYRIRRLPKAPREGKHPEDCTRGMYTTAEMFVQKGLTKKDW